MTKFTNQQLITQAREEVDFWRERDELIPSQQTAIRLRLAEITLAALTAEPDYYVVVTSVGVWQAFRKTREEAELIVTKPFNPGYSIREIYTSPPAPRVPDGYALVPVEPTEGMVIAGFEAELREEFRDPDAWETYEGMSGCEQAALRAKWCWAAMVKAAPQQVAE